MVLDSLEILYTKRSLAMGQTMEDIANTFGMTRAKLTMALLRAGYELGTERCLVPIKPVPIAEDTPEGD